MNRTETSSRLSPRSKQLIFFAYRAFLVMVLLIALPTLTIRVKSRLYVPDYGPDRQLSNANKMMKGTHAPIVADRWEPVQGFTRGLPLQPEDNVIPLETGPEVAAQEIHRAICRFQHRSPPFPLV
jgi:hypothetical protein